LCNEPPRLISRSNYENIHSHQSAYVPGRSTKTFLLHVFDDLHALNDRGSAALLSAVLYCARGVSQGSLLRLTLFLLSISKPFCIVHPTAEGLNTCWCLKNENFQYMITKLYQLKMLNERAAEDLCNRVCCDSVQCMYRTCDVCNETPLPFLLSEESDSYDTLYYKWETLVEVRTIKHTSRNL